MFSLICTWINDWVNNSGAGDLRRYRTHYDATMTVAGSGLIITLRPRQHGRHFPDDIFKCTFLNLNVWISLTISLKVVPKVRINNIPALVQILAWRRPGDKPLSEPMMVKSSTHICVTRPQLVKLQFLSAGIILCMRPANDRLGAYTKWISSWIKSIRNELHITFHVLAPQLPVPIMHCAFNCDVGAAPTSDAPTISEWSTFVLPKVWLIIAVRQFIYMHIYHMLLLYFWD